MHDGHYGVQHVIRGQNSVFASPAATTAGALRAHQKLTLRKIHSQNPRTGAFLGVSRRMARTGKVSPESQDAFGLWSTLRRFTGGVIAAELRSS